jgi:tripeptidyl-peptidase-1
MKLGLLGTTVIASSGDYGVGAFPGDNDNCEQFVVNFPSSCPYVTSVGATQIPSGGTLAGGEVAVNDWDGGSSAGGFSNQWSLPSWQRTVMSTYFTSYASPYNSSQYVPTKQSDSWS